MKGTYLLLIEVKKNARIKVGKLGYVSFKKGYYCYVGSAVGNSANIPNRILRHLKKKKKKHWHIDYLLSKPYVKIKGLFIFPEKRKEEEISHKIGRMADSTIKGFGSSDCKKCKGNLHFFRKWNKKLEERILFILF